MKADYKNWMPTSVVAAAAAGTAGFAAISAALHSDAEKKDSKALKTMSRISGAAALACGGATAWTLYSRGMYSYNGSRKLARDIIEGTAAYITLPEGGMGLDVGCGSGALTIRCAKRNPQGTMVGVDTWGIEYKPYSQALCEKNAEAEGVSNIMFQKGSATRLEFADETFDAVTSNYVYHNIMSANRQDLLLETLRVLKKGGTFAIHDVFSKAKYGNIQNFVRLLQSMGYEEVRLIDTTDGAFMTRTEAAVLGLTGSALLVGKK